MENNKYLIFNKKDNCYLAKCNTRPWFQNFDENRHRVWDLLIFTADDPLHPAIIFLNEYESNFEFEVHQIIKSVQVFQVTKNNQSVRHTKVEKKETIPFSLNIVI